MRAGNIFRRISIVVVPRILAFLNERDLKITFFIVGQDAALEKNRDAIARSPPPGTRSRNHSFNHEPWLHLYSKEQLVEEFEKTEAATRKHHRQAARRLSRARL